MLKLMQCFDIFTLSKAASLKDYSVALQIIVSATELLKRKHSSQKIFRRIIDRYFHSSAVHLWIDFISQLCIYKIPYLQGIPKRQHSCQICPTQKDDFYLKKGIVEDLLSGRICWRKIHNGKLLDDIKESMLETVLPNLSSNSYNITLTSKHNGETAKISERKIFSSKYSIYFN